MADPIEIKIRDQIASDMASEMLTTNDYQYDVGSINAYHEDPTQGTWPRLYITLGDEINNDEIRGVNNLLYNNDLYFDVYYEYKNTGDVDAQDSIKECMKLTEDIKRFVGNHYQVAASGALVIFYKGRTLIHSNNATYPTGVKVQLLVEYRQYRQDPAQYG